MTSGLMETIGCFTSTDYTLVRRTRKYQIVAAMPCGA